MKTKRNIIFLTLLFVLSTVLLFACDIRGSQGEEEEEEPNPKVTIVMTDKNANVQAEDETYTVTFSATITDIEDQSQIVWHVNGTEFQRSNLKQFSYMPAFEGVYSVTCSVADIVSNRLQITVLPAKAFTMTATTTASQQSTIVQYYGSVSKINFTVQTNGAYILGTDYTENDIKWLVNDQIKGQGFNFSYTPVDEVGAEAVIQARLKEDGKHQSNFFTVQTRLADIVVLTEGNLSQSETNPTQVEFSARALNDVSIDNMRWFVDEIQIQEGATFSFTPTTAGIYKIQGKVEVMGTLITTKPEYIIVGKPVTTVEEFNQALNDESIPTIFIENDLTFYAISSNAHIIISRKVAIAGNNKTFNSAIGASNFFSVSADGFMLRDLTITDAGRYNIQFYDCVDGYLDDITLAGAGYAGLHINRSVAVVDDMDISGSDTGIEISHRDFGVEGGVSSDRPAELFITGKLTIEHDTFLPIISSYSQDACKLHSSDFNEFIVSIDLGGETLIVRRWCNDGCNLGWKVSPPANVKYKVGDNLNLFGIALKVSMCNEEPMVFDESYIRTLLDSAVGQTITDAGALRLEFYDINNIYLRHLSVVAFDGTSYIYANENGDIVDPKLLYGDARIRLYIGDVYIGQFGIIVNY